MRIAKPSPFALLVAAALAGGLPGGLSGCSDAPKKSPSGANAPNAGLNSLGKGDEFRLSASIDPNAPLTDRQRTALAEQAAVDLAAALAAAEAKANQPAAVPPAAPLAGWDGAPLPTMTGGGGETVPGDAPSFGLKHAEPAPAPAPLPDPVAELAARLAGLLRLPEGSRMDEASALAALESARAGALAELDSAASPLGAFLTPEDRATLLAARDHVMQSPGAASDSLRLALSKLNLGPGLKITKAALCTRVLGFGRYEALTTDTFIAGRPIPILVYSELDGFASRPARDGDPAQRSAPLAEQSSVELMQSLTLYHDPSGLQAWHRPGQKVIETGRNKRRDFYLVQRAELPATLTIGRYLLKVTVTDTTTGGTDEFTLPVNISAQ